MSETFNGMNIVRPQRQRQRKPRATHRWASPESGNESVHGLTSRLANNQVDVNYNAPLQLLAAKRFMPTALANTYQDDITNAYQSVLGRLPDSGGEAYWFNRRKKGASPETIHASMRDSPEYNGIDDNATGPIVDLYQSILGRKYDPEGLLHWRNRMQNENLTVDQIADFFRASDEYRSKNPGVVAPQEQAPTNSGANAWLRRFGSF